MKMLLYCSTLGRVGYGRRLMHKNVDTVTTGHALEDTSYWYLAYAEYLCAPMKLVLLAAISHPRQSWSCVNSLSGIPVLCSSPTAKPVAVGWWPPAYSSWTSVQKDTSLCRTCEDFPCSHMVPSVSETPHSPVGLGGPAHTTALTLLGVYNHWKGASFSSRVQLPWQGHGPVELR
jgi:hypothetical protein